MKYVVVGGGIAGTSCVKRLLDESSDADEVILVSASHHVKTVVNWIKVGQFTEFFDVQESSLFSEERRLRFLVGHVSGWSYKTKVLTLSDGRTITFDRLCIANGAYPLKFTDHPKLITIRDTESVLDLRDKLKATKRIVIVGNGGIATELSYELKNVHITWIIRDKHASSPFFIEPISKFFEDRMKTGRTEGSKNEGILKRQKFDVSSTASTSRGCALGPDWNTTVSLQCDGEEHSVDVLIESEVTNVTFKDSVFVEVNSKTTVECDLVIWATGVAPDTGLWKTGAAELRLSSDGGISIDEQMRTSLPNVFACGDVCTVEWPHQSDSWKQMRLWSQARQMGDYCARSMLSNGEIDLDFCFELFAHVTTFYGYKIVLLGDFKAERQPPGWYLAERIVEDTQYVCCIMYEHRVVGAVLVGETNLEETMENLILNRTDLEQIEESFLDPAIEIDDYFD